MKEFSQNKCKLYTVCFKNVKQTIIFCKRRDSMTAYNRIELSNVLQALAGIFLIFGIARTILTFNGSVPGFALIGSAIGLAIIVGCWVGARHLHFMVTMIIASVVLSIYFNFGSLFS